MRIETHTIRVGERVSDLDWSYDFRKHFNLMCCNDAGKDRACEEAKDLLRKIEKALQEGRNVRATTDGGLPRCGLHPVIDIGMYDGWPYWTPVPSVCTRGHFGVTWHSFSSITEIEEEEKP